MAPRLPIGAFPEVAFKLFNCEFIPLAIHHERAEGASLKLSRDQKDIARKWITLGVLPHRALERAGDQAMGSGSPR